MRMGSNGRAAAAHAPPSARRTLGVEHAARLRSGKGHGSGQRRRTRPKGEVDCTRRSHGVEPEVADGPVPCRLLAHLCRYVCRPALHTHERGKEGATGPLLL